MLCRRIYFVVLLILLLSNTYSQHQKLHVKPTLWKGKQNIVSDTTSLLHAFKNGHINGHFRYYFMATNNASGLTDYYANAVGGGIKYATANYKGFQFGVSGFFVYNIGSSDLSVPDEKTQQNNRYEIGLFDITNPHNKNNIDRLEELYLKYTHKKTHITFGKQLLNTPFINLQDGRMRPTEVEGIYMETEAIKKLKVEVGYLYKISPRSTIEFFSVAESIGVNPQGVNEHGIKNDYAGNLTSDGIMQVGLIYKPKDFLKLQSYNVFVDNIFNTTLLQADITLQQTTSTKYFTALQLITQQSVNHGGNEEASKAYFKKGARSLSFGAKLGVETKQYNLSVNFNRITSAGKFLMPREWGREPFFTFLPRERNEGLCNVHAVTIKTGYYFLKQNLQVQTGLGVYFLPSVQDYGSNKYGLPSYNQLNIDVKYHFSKIVDRLELQLLYVYKGNMGNTFNRKKYVINRVNMHLLNLVLNYHF